jgi:glucose/arabinose dehydrogenase
MNVSKNKNGFFKRGINVEIFPGFCLLIFILIFGSCKKNNYSSSPPPTNANPNLQMVTDNLVAPLTVAEAPDDSKRLFIVDQVGKIWIIGADSTKLSTPFIDISSKMVSLQTGYDERGLLGLAFHPNYKSNGKFYLFYTAPPRAGGPQQGTPWNNLTRISEFKVSADANVADINSEKVILEEDHPQLNHDGGTIAFGPDGFLYISIGDGGGADDNDIGHVTDWYSVNAGGNGQDIYHNLMGNILRIDVNSGNPYSIPSDNPFVGGAARQEIYAYGFRNPYRFSFDMQGTKQLIVGDAGQSLYEEIDLVTKGGNYGWNVKEGTACFNTDNDKQTRNSCPTTDTAGNPLIDPVVQLSNAANPAGGVATVIVGGNVYRGSLLPSMAGQYIFGIFSQDGNANAKIYAATPGSGTWSYSAMSFKDFPDNLGQYIKGFGQDLSGEVYVTTSTEQGLAGATGKVYRLVGVQ